MMKMSRLKGCMMRVVKEEIKMFKEAKEIQEQWEPTEGDLVFSDNLSTPSFVTRVGVFGLGVRLNGGMEVSVSEKYPHTIVILRQDQLQALIENNCRDVNKHLLPCRRVCDGECLNDILQEFLCNYDSVSITPLSGKTLRQIWLEFVMKVVFSKIWNGKAWQKTISDEV